MFGHRDRFLIRVVAVRVATGATRTTVLEIPRLREGLLDVMGPECMGLYMFALRHAIARISIAEELALPHWYVKTERISEQEAREAVDNGARYEWSDPTVDASDAVDFFRGRNDALFGDFGEWRDSGDMVG